MPATLCDGLPTDVSRKVLHNVIKDVLNDKKLLDMLPRIASAYPELYAKLIPSVDPGGGERDASSRLLKTTVETIKTNFVTRSYHKRASQKQKQANKRHLNDTNLEKMRALLSLEVM